jgi:ABC-type multidrug transport system permease subunit
MQRWHAFTELLKCRFREFYREPEIIFWVYAFPLILAVGLGAAFTSRKPEPPVVDVQGRPDDKPAQALVDLLKANQVVAELHDADDCRQRLRVGKTALFVEPRPGRYDYHYDEARQEAVLARFQVDDLVQKAAASANARPTEDGLVSEPGNRYIDFLVPGLMGMDLMGGGLWGLGFFLSDMRIRKLLKRLVSTPMNRGDFLLSVFAFRAVMLWPEMLLLLAVGHFGFGVPVRGSPVALVLVILTGAAAFSGVGLLVGSRSDRFETVSNLINAVMMPSWILCGTFFSSRRFPDWSQPFLQALPLTQINDALREVMLEGAGLTDVAWRLAILAAYGVGLFLLGLRLFKWK